MSSASLVTNRQNEDALLRAALLPGDEGLCAARQWQAASDLDNLPQRQVELLPLVMRNLEFAGCDGQDRAKIAGIYRRVWYGNQLAINALRAIADTLRAASIPAMTIGDATLACGVYPDAGARPIGVLGVAVPREHIAGAVQELAAARWQCTSAIAAPDRVKGDPWVARFRLCFDRQLNIDLSPFLLSNAPFAQIELDGWANPVSVNRIPLGAANGALHLLRCAASPHAFSPLWLADAALLVKSGAVAWPQVVTRAAQSELVGPLLAVLEHLRHTVGIEAPPAALNELRVHPLPDYVKHAVQALQAPPALRTRTERLAIHHARFRRIAAARGIAPTPKAGMSYLVAARSLKDAALAWPD